MKRIITTSILTVLVSLGLQAQSTVLFVLSASDTILLNEGSKARQTGVFLNEFYLAYSALREAGYMIQFSTPNGVKPPIDQESFQDQYWKDQLEKKVEAEQFIANNQGFIHPIPLEEAWATRAQYVGLVIPGGQGLMVDLMYDSLVPQLLIYFAETQKPTGLICHAPSLLLALPQDKNPYVGFQVNSVSPLEEFVIESFIMKGKPQNRKIAKQLKNSGFHYVRKLPKSNFAVKDRNLVTSQNPFSSTAFNGLFLQALNDYKTK